MKRPVVYDYLDYRQLLNDLFKYGKDQNPNFSYRFFSRESGFSSPNFLKLVIDGQRNLTHTSIAKIARGFKLKKLESEFFEHLVFMNQAKTNDEKNRYYQKMLSAKGYIQAHRIEKASYEYFSKWYYPVIREVIAFSKSDQTPEKIAERLNPKITSQEAEKGIHLLLELGLIRQQSNGALAQCERVVTTGPEVTSMIIANFHKEMMTLGIESMERFPSDERDISALTISVKRECLAEIKARIASFRQELLELACEDEGSDQVYQINFQVFPLTHQG